MKGPHTTRDFDWTLLGLVLAIATLGVVEIYSATRNTVWEGAHLKQLLWIGLGLVLLWTVSRIDYKTLVDQAPVFYAIAIVLLVSVEFFGVTVGGAKRWLPLPAGLHLQVSEFVKVVLVLLVAWFFLGSSGRPVPLARLGAIGVLFAVPVVLVLRQPDLSTALSYLPILALGVFLAGVRWKHVVILALLGLLAAPIVWRQLQPYQKERLIAFVDPERDPRGGGYQSIQSKIAVGAGGIWGQGLRPRLADAVALSARPPYGFHLLGLRGRNGFRRGWLGSGALLRCFDASGRQCTDGGGYDRDAHLYGRGGPFAVSPGGERRHGDRADAGNRSAFAADELWRIERPDDVSVVRIGE